MKYRIIIGLMLFSCYSFGQREYSTGDINTINTGLTASEGDYYMDTVLNFLYLGLVDGTLWRVVDTDTDTDNQDLDLSGNVLSLTNDATTVNLAPYLDNTDDQSITNFSLTGSTLSITIEDGNTQNLDIGPMDSTLYKYDGFLRANRTVTMDGSNLTFDGTGGTALEVTAARDVGIGTSSPSSRLEVSGGEVTFSDYGTGAVSGNEKYHLAVDSTGRVIEMNTAKSSKIFYPPAVVIDVSSTGTGLTLDLHQEYLDRYGTPSVKSPSAPTAIPTYLEGELYYYITDYDVTVFDNVSVSDAGIMTYDVIAVPASNCTFVNVVFVVK